jgi:hypothetical protein
MNKDELATRAFWTAAGLRALRSFAQALLTLGGGDAAGLLSLGWERVLLAAAGYAVTSVLTSVVVGIPEAPSPPPTSP